MRPIIKFLQESRVELAKVSWPTRATVISLTFAVLLTGIILTVYVAAIDYGLTAGVKWITTESAKVKGASTGGQSGVTATDSNGQSVNVDGVTATPTK